ncbi:MAG: TrbM/KikA/MpfK family conjugal transfer protein [Nitrospira sp.]|nr:TrbM/KikA/MpfK family conjugal transfer protein [Nitrospira sp.]
MTRHRFILSAVALAVLCFCTRSADAESPGVPPPVPALSSGPPSPSVTPVPSAMSPNSGAVSLLTGTARDACEALLCLSAIGSAPAECAASLAKYHAVQMFGGGPAFLAACPLVR